MDLLANYSSDEQDDLVGSSSTDAMQDKVMVEDGVDSSASTAATTGTGATKETSTPADNPSEGSAPEVTDGTKNIAGKKATLAPRKRGRPKGVPGRRGKRAMSPVCTPTCVDNDVQDAFEQAIWCQPFDRRFDDNAPDEDGVGNEKAGLCRVYADGEIDSFPTAVKLVVGDELKWAKPMGLFEILTVLDFSRNHVVVSSGPVLKEIRLIITPFSDESFQRVRKQTAVSITDWKQVYVKRDPALSWKKICEHKEHFEGLANEAIERYKNHAQGTILGVDPDMERKVSSMQRPQHDAIADKGYALSSQKQDKAWRRLCDLPWTSTQFIFVRFYRTRFKQ
jgi:hypothetical protein